MVILGLQHLLGLYIILCLALGGRPNRGFLGGIGCRLPHVARGAGGILGGAENWSACWQFVIEFEYLLKGLIRCLGLRDVFIKCLNRSLLGGIDCCLPDAAGGVGDILGDTEKWSAYRQLIT